MTIMLVVNAPLNGSGAGVRKPLGSKLKQLSLAPWRGFCDPAWGGGGLGEDNPDRVVAKFHYPCQKFQHRNR